MRPAAVAIFTIQTEIPAKFARGQRWSLFLFRKSSSGESYLDINRKTHILSLVMQALLVKKTKKNMKHLIQMTTEEAKGLARKYYGVGGDTNVEITDLPTTQVDLRLDFNKAIAQSNKIALIKMVRSACGDFVTGRGLERNENDFPTLASVKAWVEKYFSL